MSGPVGSSQWMYATDDFALNQSLRFDKATDASHLSFIPSGAGNRKTFTFSAWVKRGNISVQQTLMSVNSANDNSGILHIYLDSDDEIKISFASFTLTTTPLLRDPSAWYHIMFVADTTQASEGNRFKIYLNGTQLTLGSSGTFIAQNTDLAFSQATEHNIGRRDGGADRYFDGYLSEVHFVDGTALTPATFGETDDDYGHWKPKRVGGVSYGTNGFYLNFAGGGILAATGGTITTDGDYKVHSFTADGTFTPTSVPGVLNYVEYLVIGGGGSGGQGYRGDGVTRSGGGGGAGGYRNGVLTVTAQAYSITVGAGGAAVAPNAGAGANPGLAGSNSVFSSITATGGGGGGSGHGGGPGNGGSGGGGAHHDTSGGSANAGFSQGTDGGRGQEGGSTGGYHAGGGGGAGGAGAGGSTDTTGNGAGGAGKTSYITGAGVTRAGGGGGAGTHAVGAAGSGGATAGDSHATPTANTGSGGGGAAYSNGNTSAGAAGVVIIRYKFQ